MAADEGGNQRSSEALRQSPEALSCWSRFFNLFNSLSASPPPPPPPPRAF